MQLKTTEQVGSVLMRKEKRTSGISQLNNRMKRRPYIKGVSGPTHLGFMDKYCGTSDMKQHQLCWNDDQILTPNVLRMYGCLDSYMNGIYTMAVKELTELYEETASLNTEINNIRFRKVRVIEATGEEGARQYEALQTQQLQDVDRMEEIRIRAAGLKEVFSSIDEAIKHHLENADRIARSHISAYWKGVLKANAGSDNLPAYPVVIEQPIDGITVYESHLDQVKEMIENILTYTEQEQEVTEE